MVKTILKVIAFLVSRRENHNLSNNEKLAGRKKVGTKGGCVLMQKDLHRHILKAGRNKAIHAPKDGQCGWGKEHMTSGKSWRKR